MVRTMREQLDGVQEGDAPPHVKKALEAERRRQAKVDEIHAAIDNVRAMVNTGQLSDSKLLVLAVLTQARATMLVAERLDELDGSMGCQYEAS